MTPPEFLYLLGLSVKKRYSLKHRKRLPFKVLSVGNLTFGGTGKTPATIALAREAGNRGLKPCVLTRGYKGKAKGPCLVSRGEGPLLNEYQAGDEAVLMAEKLQGVPVIKGRNRYEAGIFAIQNLFSQICDRNSEFIFILDDGYQHWGLLRDKDVLLIDSTNPFGNGRLPPLGPLREPVNSMNRADIIVITKNNQKSPANSLIREIREYNKQSPVYFAGHKPSQFVTVKGDTFPLDWANDKKFFAFCGIGNPQSFRGTLISAGLGVTGFKAFRDHHRYGNADIRAITGGARMGNADWIVTTEKDIMRLKGLELPENLVALAIEFKADEEFYDEAFNF
jgi:tetraacyldisaccharide 4'-kinase